MVMGVGTKGVAIRVWPFTCTVNSRRGPGDSYCENTKCEISKCQNVFLYFKILRSTRSERWCNG